MSSDQNLIFTVSIDDGHPSDMKAGEILSKHRVRATFFVPIRNREGARVLSPANLREIAGQFEIGSHTVDHCYLKGLDHSVARYQVVDGKRRLEELLGRATPGFCYPGGKYSRSHAALVKAAGFQYARTTVNLCFDSGDQVFEMPTTLQFYPHPPAVYLRNFLRGGRWGRRLAGLRLALQQEDWITRIYRLFDHACARGGVFHLWGHTKDIDELQAWKQFDQFIAYAAARVDPLHRLDNSTLARRRFGLT